MRVTLEMDFDQDSGSFEISVTEGVPIRQFLAMLAVAYGMQLATLHKGSGRTEGEVYGEALADFTARSWRGFQDTLNPESRIRLV